MNPETFECSVCHVHKPCKATPDAITFGYATIRETGERVCVACCGDTDKRALRQDERTTLYLVERTPQGHEAVPARRSIGYQDAQRFTVTNWPGTLKHPVTSVRKGRHNWAGVRYDVWFRFEGINWHGVQYGDNTQILHCRRIA